MIFQTRSEVKLVEATLQERVVDAMPQRLIGDKAYDSDVLDCQTAENCGIEFIAPNRSNRKIGLSMILCG